MFPFKPILKLEEFIIRLKWCQLSVFVYVVAMQKMTNHINNQAMKLTNLQKKVDNITLAVNDVKSTYSSLEGKISEDKGKEFQYFLKGKTKNDH